VGWSKYEVVRKEEVREVEIWGERSVEIFESRLRQGGGRFRLAVGGREMRTEMRRRRGSIVKTSEETEVSFVLQIGKFD